MRKPAIAIAALGVLWGGYIVWPIYGLYQLARAVERADTEFVIRHIDFTTVRRSFVQQIMDTYFERTGKKSLLMRGLVGPAETLADPFVAKFISPEALTDLMRKGWPTGILRERPRDAVGLSVGGLGDAWRLFAAAEYGFGRFQIDVPVDLETQRSFGLQFSLKQWRWQLKRLRLPQSVRVLIVNEVIRSLKE